MRKFLKSLFGVGSAGALDLGLVESIRGNLRRRTHRPTTCYVGALSTQANGLQKRCRQPACCSNNGNGGCARPVYRTVRALLTSKLHERKKQSPQGSTRSVSRWTWAVALLPVRKQDGTIIRWDDEKDEFYVRFDNGEGDWTALREFMLAVFIPIDDRLHGVDKPDLGHVRFWPTVENRPVFRLLILIRRSEKREVFPCHYLAAVDKTSMWPMSLITTGRSLRGEQIVYKLLTMPNVTRLLDAAAAGDRHAAADLLPFVYDELRKMAAVRMASEAPGHTLEATALVHEAYCGSSVPLMPTVGTIAATSSPPLLRPCGGFLSRVLAAIAAPSTVAAATSGSGTSMRSPSPVHGRSPGTG